MLKVVLSVLCSLTVPAALQNVPLDADKPFERSAVSQEITLKCCYGSDEPVTWEKHVQGANRTVNVRFVENSDLVNISYVHTHSSRCGTLTLKSVQPNDTGLYRCLLNRTHIHTHGTYLQVYKPMKKTLNLSERTKNRILMAEGILLFLCVLVPSATILFKSKQQNEVEKKKSRKEEENIYQGLNLDECYATYDQIECTPAQGHYQDARTCNEDVDLEKP
ncbi:B-cell antigen receptor complex-associated protein alpha chain [Salarias fasciatus]|uniref:Ig-like domain-containing protein n=1 Tax=Salarias fasciatus TaxID=181472 RepID=A0A672FCQ1_SALFA|nr:B-cell antigen receptor complex-associated protein alpha chain [Salarias fasciatus]